MSEKNVISLNGDNIKSVVSQFGSLMVNTFIVKAITEGLKLMIDANTSRITLSEYDSAYDPINKYLYQLDKEKYNRFRNPVNNRDSVFLTDGITYMIRLNKNNIIKVISNAVKRPD